MKYCIILALINIIICSTIVDIQINEEFQFNTSSTQFGFGHSKKTEKSSIFILFYEKVGDLQINIKSPDSEEGNTIPIKEDIGFISFPFTEDGDYEINFIPVSSEDKFEGKGKIISTEEAFTLDSNRDISFDELAIDSESEPNPLIFSLENASGENFMKKVSIGKSKMYIKENDEDYKEVIGDLIYFNKDSEYLIKLEFLKDEDDENSFYITDFSLTNFDYNLTKIEDFSLGTKFNKNMKYLFEKINLNENNNFWVKTPDDGQTVKFAYADEDQYNNFPNDIQYLEFYSLTNEKIEKPENKDYMILFIEFDSKEYNIIFFAKDIPIELNEEKEFGGENILFKLNYEKKNKDNALLYLFIEYENVEAIGIDITNVDSSGHGYTIERNIDSINYIVRKSGEYYILFISLGDARGNLKIVSSEYDFTIDANKEIYFRNILSQEEEKEGYQSNLKFSISNIDKYYKKIYSSSNNLEDIISYSKNNKEMAPMKNGLFLYEPGEMINLILDVKKIIYKDIVHISNLDEINISELEFGNYDFTNPINKIFKINYLTTPSFKIEGDDSNRYYLANVIKMHYDSINYCLGNLTYDVYKDNTYIKPDNFDYAILIVEILNINSTLKISELAPSTNELKFDSEQKFNSFYSKYQLEYEKNENKEKFIFMYKMNQNSNNFGIKITGPDGYEKEKIFENKEKVGSHTFENGESGNYTITFSSNDSFGGTFKIVKTSDVFKMNINDNIKLNSFTVDYKPNPIIMEFNTKDLVNSTYKEFFIGENNKNLNLVQISPDGDDTEYKQLNLNYYGFEKQKEYKIKIDYTDLGDNQYKFEQFIMNPFEFNLEDFQYGKKTFRNDTKVTFLKIDFSKTSTIVVNSTNSPTIKIAYYNDDLDMVKILNDLEFVEIKNNNINDNSYKKGILMIQCKTGITDIDFSNGKNGGDGDDDSDDNKDDDDNNILLYCLCIGGGIILLLLIIFLIYRLKKRKSAENDFSAEAKKEEMLMPTD